MSRHRPGEAAGSAGIPVSAGTDAAATPATIKPPSRMSASGTTNQATYQGSRYGAASANSSSAEPQASATGLASGSRSSRHTSRTTGSRNSAKTTPVTPDSSQWQHRAGPIAARATSRAG